MDNKALENFITEAKENNIPKEQLINFIKGKYIPLKWQLKFHSVCRDADNENGPVDIGAGGARGPGKSKAIFSQLTLDDCQRIPGLKGLFLRQTGKSASESFEDLINDTLKGKVQYEYNSSQNVLKFANGSKVILGGFETERDIDKYVGIQYDVMAIEERNQITGSKIEKLKGSLRTTKPNWRARMYSSFNPGNIGHQDIKKTFILPYQMGEETITKFIPSTYRDNPYLQKEYIDYLNSLPGALGKAWREGDFDTFEGMYFSEWDYNQHVIEPFKIPESWIRIRGIDVSGRKGTTSCHIYAIDYDGNVYITHEHYKTGLDADEHARQIRTMSEGIDIRYTVIDTSAFDKLGMPETLAEIYERNGVLGLVPASKQRIPGWNFVHQYLRWDKDNKPKLRIFKNCVNIIRTIPLAIHDENKPEDIKSIYIGAEHNDALDELRYVLQTLRDQSSPKPLTYIERRIEQLKHLDNIDYSYMRTM